MGYMPIKFPPNEVRSMVLEAIDTKTKILGLTISDDAKRMILQKALPNLERINQEGELEEKVGLVRYNSAEFIQLLFDQSLNGKAGEITIDHVSSLLSSFCQRFPDFIPFCP